jgi:hypothetical protein
LLWSIGLIALGIDVVLTPKQDSSFVGLEFEILSVAVGRFTLRFEEFWGIAVDVVEACIAVDRPAGLEWKLGEPAEDPTRSRAQSLMEPV